jgi:hypothetical protein
MEKDLEGSNCAPIEVLSQHLFRETEENHENTQDILCPGQGSNRAPAKYKFRAFSAWPDIKHLKERPNEIFIITSD